MKLLHHYTKTVLTGMLALTAFSSCEDFLTVLPTDRIVEEKYWRTKGDLDNVRAAAYQKLTTGEIANRIMFWGEIRSDNVTVNNFSQTGVLYALQGNLQPTNGIFSWGDFYTGIGYCNKVLEHGQEMANDGRDPSFREGDFRPYQAEMTALRGLYYFYLVRAFRNVPYVTKSVSTDQDAWNYGPIPATNGEAVLEDQIKLIEKYKDYAAINYGLISENKGRFTKMSIRALLADMYLWRGCMLLNHGDKEKREGVAQQVNFTDVPVIVNGDTTGYTLADGTPIDTAYTNAQARLCFQKAIDYSTEAINLLKGQFVESYGGEHNVPARLKEQPYPLMQNIVNIFGSENLAYEQNLGRGNSLESFFEVQFDGSTNVNKVPVSYFSIYDGDLKPQAVSASSVLFGNVNIVDPTTGFGKTDFRLWETLAYKENSTMAFTKYVASDITIEDSKDVSKRATLSYRNTSSLGSNFSIYRLTDMMLIKAEAIARLNPTAKGEPLREAFDLVNYIFARNNPSLGAQSGKEQLTSTELNSSSNIDEYRNERLNKDYCLARGNNTNTPLDATQLLQLIYRERQREFVMEGKRWFDLARQGEAVYSLNSGVDEVFRSYIGVSSAVRNRLRNLNSLYCPIHNEEIKVNKALKQNPVWKNNI